MTFIIAYFKYENSHQTRNEFNGPETYNFDLGEGNRLFEGEAEHSEMGDYQISFMGYVEEFQCIKIGGGYEGTSESTLCVITADKLEIINSRSGTLLDEYAIDLNARDYVGINIDVDWTDHANIYIYSNESTITINNAHWYGRRGHIFAEAIGNTVLNQCTLSCYVDGINKPIWLFGDSYFDCSSPSRWTSYLTQNGYSNFLLNAYPGRTSKAALSALKNELLRAVPLEIIWCMGMNDGDCEDAVNENWQETLDEVIKICENNDIELILATIPSCPSVNNNYKNAIVQNSGYRYIDFAKAVGSYESVSWYDGMLENTPEPVHPTVEGAKALYSEAVATCPELLSKQ